jgi:membrane-associated phospholipid phosphatase
MSRLADRQHHITDAAAGAGIGFLIGHTISSRMKVPSRVSMNVYKVRGGFTGVVRIGLR